MSEPTTTQRKQLTAFVSESNRIEGIHRAPTREEVDVHFALLRQGNLTVEDIQLFVSVMQPDAVLRDRAGLNVYVGNHVPPPGSAGIRIELDGLLSIACSGCGDPYIVHRSYETLHPFTDGNGRSGRALWLWMMLSFGQDAYVLSRGFLHTWYYQSLARRP